MTWLDDDRPVDVQFREREAHGKQEMVEALETLEKALAEYDSATTTLAVADCWNHLNHYLNQLARIVEHTHELLEGLP